MDKKCIKNIRNPVHLPGRIELWCLRWLGWIVTAGPMISLVWRGPVDKVLDQGTYTVSHPDIGDLQLFLVTIGPDEHGMRYEAVFT